MNPKWIIEMTEKEYDDFNLAHLEATGVQIPHERIDQFLRGNRVYYYEGKINGYYSKKMVDFILDRIHGGLWKI